MQLINTKITYLIGENKIKCNELHSQDYNLKIENTENTLKAILETSSSLQDFEVSFFVQIDKKYTEFLSNGYQTWSKAEEISSNTKTNKYKDKICNFLIKNSGWDYTGEYQSPYNDKSSFGLCYFSNNNDNIMLFSSLNENEAFTKFSFDFSDYILKITRSYFGSTINKLQEVCNIVCIVDNFKRAFCD